MAQSRLWPAGTLCITIAANIADSALLTYPACFPDSVVGLIVDAAVCVPEYVEFFLRTARSNIAQFAPATAQRNINLAILGEVAVPLPSIAEQEEIVRRATAALALASAASERCKIATECTARLYRSVLTQAFRGQLLGCEMEETHV